MTFFGGEHFQLCLQRKRTGHRRAGRFAGPEQQGGADHGTAAVRRRAAASDTPQPLIDHVLAHETQITGLLRRRRKGGGPQRLSGKAAQETPSQAAAILGQQATTAQEGAAARVVLAQEDSRPRRRKKMGRRQQQQTRPRQGPPISATMARSRGLRAWPKEVGCPMLHSAEGARRALGFAPVGAQSAPPGRLKVPCYKERPAASMEHLFSMAAYIVQRTR